MSVCLLELPFAFLNQALPLGSSEFEIATTRDRHRVGSEQAFRGTGASQGARIFLSKASRQQRCRWRTAWIHFNPDHVHSVVISRVPYALNWSEVLVGGGRREPQSTPPGASLTGSLKQATIGTPPFSGSAPPPLSECRLVHRCRSHHSIDRPPACTRFSGTLSSPL